LGHFVNDLPRRLANCYTKVIAMAGRPHVLIFAGKDIAAGDELRYDYGGGDMP
jgi:SET domain-containing protein